MSALSDTVRSMGRAKIVGMLGAGFIMLTFFMVLTLRMSTGGLSPLYTGLSMGDSAKIVAELEKTGVPFELNANGSEILVPSDRLLRLRMTMAEQSLPSGGAMVGYEIFDRSESFGSSNFVMNVNMLRALEGELARTINTISGVDSARVHLVMPKQELFTRDKEKPSASVILKTRGGTTLERGEIAAVTHLVASSVPGLEASRVTVVDNHGRLLARGTGDEGMDATASAAEDYRRSYENQMQQNLESLLEKVIGAGKVRVQVAADIDFDRTVTNSEKFDPEGQVARSTQSTSEKNNSMDKGAKDNVSVANNLPGGAAGGGEAPGSSANTERSDETTNYEISKTTQNHVSEGGTVKKLSVAVLVDGTYTTDADGNQKYAPRPDDEVKQLRSLVNSAIGYDEKRGDKVEIVNMRFTQDTLDLGGESLWEHYKMEFQSIIQTLIIAVVAILAILLVLRPAVVQLIKTSQAPSDRVAGELAALETPASVIGRLPGAPAPAGGGGGGAAPGTAEPELLIDVANIKGGMRSSSIKKVSEIVDKYPEETMGVLRQWVLKQS